MGIKCVKCGSNNTAAYVYGQPIMDEELEQNISEHKIILGGCNLTDFNPKYHCNECKNDFGYSAKRVCNNRIVDYIEDTVYLMFSVEYVNFGKTKLVLSKKDDKYFVTIYTPSKKFVKEISEKEFRKNLTTIFGKAYVLEWDEKYVRLPEFDGTKWNLEIRCNDGNTFMSYGKSCFPPYYKKAKSRHDYYLIKAEFGEWKI